MQVPLLPGDADIDLDLQPIFDQVYDRGGMEYLIDYRQGPDCRLAPDWHTWSVQLLRGTGKRPRRRERGP